MGLVPLSKETRGLSLPALASHPQPRGDERRQPSAREPSAGTKSTGACISDPPASVTAGNRSLSLEPPGLRYLLESPGPTETEMGPEAWAPL